MDANVLRVAFTVVMLVEVFVCKQEPCSPWIYNIEQHKCYRKYCDARQFEDAQKMCQQQGGNMVTICNREENFFIAMLAYVATGYPNGTHTSTWIGYLRNPNNMQQWKWISGSTCNYTNWVSGEPNNAAKNENYAQLYFDGWNDHSPASFQYICERSTCPQEDNE